MRQPRRYKIGDVVQVDFVRGSSRLGIVVEIGDTVLSQYLVLLGTKKMWTLEVNCYAA